MKRLDFRLPEFMRAAWVSDAARARWQPRVARVNAAWSQLTWLSVRAGVRRCSLEFSESRRLDELTSRMRAQGLTALPIDRHGASGSNYSASSPPFRAGRPFNYRVAIGGPREVSELQKAHARSDDTRVGELLGYPACCTRFFRRVWIEERYLDTTWPMACNTEVPRGTVLELSGPAEANILLRWLGVRAVFHLPCRVDCEASASVGRDMLELCRRSGFHEESEWLLEMLSWPVEWTALHGIAEIKTPVFKITTQSDATPVKYTVRRAGSALPAEAAPGLGFPYAPSRERVTRSKSHKQGLDNLIRTLTRRPDWYYLDNGFSSEFTMHAAHRAVVDAMVKALGRHARPCVLDLGSGNGALLEALARKRPGVQLAGVDVDGAKIAHARELLPHAAGDFHVGDVFDTGADWAKRRYDLVLLMPGRLLEVSPERAAALRAWLARSAQHVVVYAYGDWLERYGSLAALAERCGLAPAGTPAHASAFSARVATGGQHG